MSASPSEIRSPHMEALARLPVFFALGGKRGFKVNYSKLERFPCLFE